MRMAIRSAVVVWLAFAALACSSSDVTLNPGDRDGEITLENDAQTEGDAPADGDSAADGDVPPDGDAPADGDSPADGDLNEDDTDSSTDGDVTDDDTADHDPLDSDPAEGEVAEYDLADGDLAESDLSDGDSDDAESESGQTPCTSDRACLTSEYCALSVGGKGVCVAHRCKTTETPLCEAFRPDCGNFRVAIVVGSCWGCVDLFSCQASTRQCDDGTLPACNRLPDECQAGEILAFVNNCYSCVNPVTCNATCSYDRDCRSAKSYCERGSGKGLCTAHSCPTIDSADCKMTRPECGPGRVAIVEGNCWRCVSRNTCAVNESACDDGTAALCDSAPPICSKSELLAVKNGCWACVNPATCQPWGEKPGCLRDADCPPEEYCDPQGTTNCPGCSQTVAACAPHGCATESALLSLPRPNCGEKAVAIQAKGRWVCVKRDKTCAPLALDPRCDDGTSPVCLLPLPNCTSDEIMAAQKSCFVCVNPATCKAWGNKPGCASDLDCPKDAYCDPCATSSSPSALDCVAACKPHHCPYEALGCRADRPPCAAGQTALTHNGCWECATLETCRYINPAQSACQDGSLSTCLSPDLSCKEGSILGLMDHCLSCLNPTTCKAWGVAGCEQNSDCAMGEICDRCGTSGCPNCDNCLAACQ